MLNIVALQGRLAADPELRTTQNGLSVASFRIAVDRSFPDKNGQRQADFINIVAWRGTAEFVCKYFTKGQMIVLNGRIQTRSYEDKNGNQRTAVEVLAENVSFCGQSGAQRGAGTDPRKEVGSPAPQARPSPLAAYDEEYENMAFDDNLPF